MTCQKCGSVLPDDSKFCQVCGTRLEDVPLFEVAQEAAAAPAGGAAEWEENDQAQVPVGVPVAPVESKKRGVPVAAKVFLIILPVLLVVSLAVNVAQLVRGAGAAQLVADQQDTIQRQESEIYDQDRQIADLTGKVYELGITSGYYEQICDVLSSGKIGYAANNFRTSESVIVVSKNQTNRKITLTAYWSNGGTVSTDYSGSSAYLSYDANEWNTSTTLTIEPQFEGLTTVTFSNNRDSDTFKILIIVTE